MPVIREVAEAAANAIPLLNLPLDFRKPIVAGEEIAPLKKVSATECTANCIVGSGGYYSEQDAARLKFLMAIFFEPVHSSANLRLYVSVPEISV